jgi:hypothetical protein
MVEIDLLGALVSMAIFVLSSGVFLARLLGRSDIGHRIGAGLLLTSVPLAVLIASAPRLQRPLVYYIQIGLMLTYLGVCLILDYVPKIEFRHVRWAVVAYVMLFFAATGGMIGVAVEAGHSWMIASVILFLAMGALAFIQRAKTGL